MLNGLQKVHININALLESAMCIGLRSNWSAKHSVQWAESKQPISVLVEKVESRII
jgi:hypothetical protein